jgi:hypothetical protein
LLTLIELAAVTTSPTASAGYERDFRERQTMARNARLAGQSGLGPHVRRLQFAGWSEPPVGIEPTTYSLRVNRSAD